MLALATIASLWFTRRALKQTREEIGLPRQEVEEAHRPVLIPVLDSTREMKLGDGRTAPAGPAVPGNRLLVPVENIGSGPALEVEMGLTLHGYTVPEGLRGQEHTMNASGIGIGHLTSLELPLAGAVSTPFDLRLSYRDVADKAWITTASFQMGMAQRYDDLSIEADTND
jgi:hypothetical protein